MSVPPCAFLEILDCLEELARCRQIANILQHIRFRADKFICLREVGTSAVTDNLLRDVSSEGVARHPRKRIRTTALQRDFEILQRLLCPFNGVDFLKPAVKNFSATH